VPVITDHYVNLNRRRTALALVGFGPGDSVMKELDGERVAAEFMTGVLLDSTGAPNPHCPAAGQYEMVKGFTRPDAGIDQLWVDPPGWTPAAGLPNEIVIVEAKGGGATTSVLPVYRGETGRDGNRLKDGCDQMSADWVYVLGSQLENSAVEADNIRALGSLLRQRLGLGGIGPPPIITGKVIQENKAINPADGQPLLDTTYNTYVAPPPVVPVGPPTRKRGAPAPAAATVQNVLTNSPGGSMVARCQQVTNAQGLQPVVNPPQPVLARHYANLQRRKAALEAEAQEAALQNAGGYLPDYRRDEIFANVRKGYNEIKGEIQAANFMANQQVFGVTTYKMVSGFTDAHKGIDQIWVRPANWTPAAGPPAEIIVLESKGGDAALSRTSVYMQEVGCDGNPLAGGCEQMDPDWVYVNADHMSQAADETPHARAAAQYIRDCVANPAIAGPPPVIRGAVVRNGQLDVPSRFTNKDAGTGYLNFN
jgi:hypothetical protein